jgi:hypothetical protein
MDDAIARYRAASEANDMPALLATLAPQVELVSPISGRMCFRGIDDVGFLLGRVYGLMRELRWSSLVRIGPHLRPWLALTVFATVLGPKVAIRPGVVLRALKTP